MTEQERAFVSYVLAIRHLREWRAIEDTLISLRRDTSESQARIQRCLVNARAGKKACEALGVNPDMLAAVSVPL